LKCNVVGDIEEGWKATIETLWRVYKCTRCGVVVLDGVGGVDDAV